MGFPGDPSSVHCCLLSTLRSVIPRRDGKHHLYADDTQILLSDSLPLRNIDLSLDFITKRLQNVSFWAPQIKFKLNIINYLLIGSNVRRETLLRCFLAKLVGPIYNNRYLALKALLLLCKWHAWVRRFLTSSVANTIAESLTGIKLDCCNYLLWNITENKPSKL